VDVSEEEATDPLGTNTNSWVFLGWLIPLSSSRTSCLSKGEVMSCGAGITAASSPPQS
jgi:hypothetical protein